MKEQGTRAAAFELLDGARARVVGALDFSTVTALLPMGSEAIRSGRASMIDLAAVTGSDSSGLALLIEWLSVAKAAHLPLRYENIPSQLAQLAKLSDVAELLAGEPQPSIG
ncbi:MAG TPA: STAS domain-containing protein [Steroidobacteraceae bacterium]|nr:STAS domain-containing protein [Steroidobacteraceae bacterium]